MVNLTINGRAVQAPEGATILEAARLAPSSMNSQPWRFVVYDNRIHIFSKKHSAEQLKKWDEVNFGIMFANLMVAAEEGISILPSFVTSKITNGDNLKFIPLEGSEEFVDIYALWKKNRKNQILEHFLEEIR